MAFYVAKYKKVWEHPDNDKTKPKRQELKYMSMYELTPDEFLKAGNISSIRFDDCEYIYKLYEELVYLKSIYSNNPLLIIGKHVG